MSAQVDVEVEEDIDVYEPKMWSVIFVNDDTTPMGFVISLLMSIFKHDIASAEELTLAIHNLGSAVVGEYTFEIAEAKAIEVTNLSRASGYPLNCIIRES